MNMGLMKKIKSEVFAIVLIGFSIFMALSVWSYHPTDMSIHTFSWQKNVQNWCGLVGSFSSDLLLKVFGMSIWFLILRVLWIGLDVAWKQNIEWSWTKSGWGLSLFFLTATLMQLHGSHLSFYDGHIMSGGLVGWVLTKGFILVFNQLGSTVIFWMFWTLCFVMYFEKTVSDVVKKSVEMSFQLLKTSFGFFRQKMIDFLRNKPSKSIDLKNKLLKFNIQETKKSISDPDSRDLKNKSQSETNLFTNLSQAEAYENAQDQMLLELEGQGLKKRKIKFKKQPIVTRIEQWSLPQLELVEDPPESRIKIDQQDIKDRAKILTDKLSLFGVTGEVVAAKSGPAVTLYEFRPDSSVKISKITELADDLSMALSSQSLRIIAPIPGRDVVGIETANKQREVVYLKDMLAEEKFWNEDLKLPMALGRKVDGSVEIADLRKLPHLLVAGTTGSGKSVFTVSTIIGLIFRHSPKTLKLILVDPKQVDLAAFEKIPHLAMPLVTDSRQAVQSLKWAVNEMEKRYRSMSQFGARGIESFNETVSILSDEQKKEHEQINFDFETTTGKRGDLYYYEPQPYLVIVVEEFADLMSVDKNNVEHSVIRLAQKARACGIHLILCLQSPRKEFVTGAIKSNIPGRIAFKAASAMESRIILDEGGAERLLASGDMLYRGPGSAHVIRHHGPYLKDQDIQNITHFWSEQSEPQYDPEILRSLEGQDSSSSFDSNLNEEQDERYSEVINWLQSQKEVSASLIQRRFALGYPRAARLIENFERNGVVGPANGSKPRQVLIHNLKDL